MALTKKVYTESFSLEKIFNVTGSNPALPSPPLSCVPKVPHLHII